MVEFAQQALTKIHVGHLRNFFWVKCCKCSSRKRFEVLATSYINDLGMHV